MSTLSIAGNENFTLVENSAGVLQNLQTSFEQSVESRIQNLTVYDENFAKEVVGLGTIFTVTGYAPDNFGTAKKNGGVFLNRVPNNKAATAVTDSQLLHLPIGARIIAMRITNNGTKITGPAGPPASEVNIDCQAWSASGPSGDRLAKGTATGAEATAAASVRGINSPAGVKFWPAAHESEGNFTYPDQADYPRNTQQSVTVTSNHMTLGTKGEEQGRDDLAPKNSVVVTPDTREVGVHLLNQDLSTGDLAAKLWYIAP